MSSVRGRMWMILEQVEETEVQDRGDVVVTWDEEVADILDAWKEVVRRCLKEDPNNQRVRIGELMEFWEETFDHK